MTSTSLQFGCLPAKEDHRNIPMASLLPASDAPLPEEYDFDAAHEGIPTPMLANDRYGCCVVAATGHQTIRNEVIEQGSIIKPTDEEIITEWHKENGNTDQGLYILDHTKIRRKEGVVAGGKNYKIKAFAQVSPLNHAEVKTAICNDIGLIIGLALPDTAMQEFNSRRPWIDTSGQKNYQNGHCVYVTGYNHIGPVCITWGRKQQMSWEFFDAYCYEAYGTIDASNLENVNFVALIDCMSRLGLKL